MMEEFDRKKDDEKYDEIVFNKKMYGDMFLFDNDSYDKVGREERELAINLKGELGKANNNLDEKVEREDR
jgi:hypothetical protein